MFQESQSIIGRDEELMSVDGFLGAIEGGPVALLLDGEAGIGKTVLWSAGLAAASERSYRVLACCPIESETEMAYAALGDLLSDHAADVLAGLPGPQRRAIEVALLLREPEEELPAQRAVAVATLGVLAALSRERPLLVGIDDVQWLDPESESVLAFVARRLRHERIGVLVARRAEAAVDVPLDLARAMPEGRFGRVRIEPMGSSELDRLLAVPSGCAAVRAIARAPACAVGWQPLFCAGDRACPCSRGVLGATRAMTSRFPQTCAT